MREVSGKAGRRATVDRLAADHEDATLQTPRMLRVESNATE
jgi:hypothetical protein